MNQRNNLELFPALRFKILQAYAKEWAEQLAEIGIPPEQVRLFAGRSEGRRYVLAFSVPQGEANPNLPAVYKFRHHFHHRQLNHRERVSWEDRLAEIYRTPPEEGNWWLRDWDCCLVSEDEENDLESLVQLDRCWVLWEVGGKQNDQSVVQPKKLTKKQLMWECVLAEARKLAHKNENITLTEIAESDEVNRCFSSDKTPSIETIVKHLQGQGLTKKGRRQAE